MFLFLCLYVFLNDILQLSFSFFVIIALNMRPTAISIPILYICGENGKMGK